MDVQAALEPLVALRKSADVVITNQGSAREWPKLCEHPLDFHFIPSAMGGAIPLGLGIALAQPHRQVLVISGDGSLLMNLGCLVSVVDSQVTNLSIVLLDNGSYEVTGGQQTAARENVTDFAAFAYAAGWTNCFAFDEATSWKEDAARIFELSGLRFVALKVDLVTTDYLLDPPMPMPRQLAAFRSALLADSESADPDSEKHSR